MKEAVWSFTTSDVPRSPLGFDTQSRFSFLMFISGKSSFSRATWAARRQLTPSLPLLILSRWFTASTVPPALPPSQLGSWFSMLQRKSFCFTNRNTQSPTGRRMCPFLTVSHEHMPSECMGSHQPCQKTISILSRMRIKCWHYLVSLLVLSCLKSKWETRVLLLNQRSSCQSIVVVLQKEGIMSVSDRQAIH